MTSYAIPPKRFLTDNPVAYKIAIDAAESYVSNMQEGEIGWLYSKPFDPTPGNPQYFRLMFDLLNLLQAMELPAHARLLEIGSGSGWITEILLMMGFSVDALEPSSDMNQIAQKRCAALEAHYHLPASPDVRFHQTTLEEVAFEPSCFDAVLFFDALHHVVDEEVALEKCFRFLKPGGCLGVVEGAWRPGAKAFEQALLDEMARFGTLENPFSVDYIDHLLQHSGFTEIQHYVGINGFFSEAQLSRPMLDFSAQPLNESNHLTARKPSDAERSFPNCADLSFKTDVQLTLVSGGINALTRSASLVVQLKNTGGTLLSNRSRQTGHITLALRQGQPGAASFLEAKQRHRLSETLIPGGELRMELSYTLPQDASLENWELDVVCEGLYWFSSLGVKSCLVSVQPEKNS